jgi:hypothetical protein
MAKKKQLVICGLALMCSLFVFDVKAQDPPATPAQAVSPEKLRLIRELLELSSSKKTIDAMLKAQSEELEKQMPEIIWQAVSNMEELKTLTPEELKEMKSRVLSNAIRGSRRMYALIIERIDFNKLIEDISVPVHDKYFTESELKDLIAFYKSPTGIKVIEVMPNLFAESMTRATEIMMPKITDIIRQLQKEETELAAKQIQEAVKTKEKPVKSGRTPRKRSRP